ncbi:hypothetical protein HZA45_00975, partial [Candidatus Peregrinibacteria bacterium]|nr:hypothetical protein [Candidatus Peregrinibacteria bacterium]
MAELEISIKDEQRNMESSQVLDTSLDGIAAHFGFPSLEEMYLFIQYNSLLYVGGKKYVADDVSQSIILKMIEAPLSFLKANENKQSFFMTTIFHMTMRLLHGQRRRFEVYSMQMLDHTTGAGFEIENVVRDHRETNDDSYLIDIMHELIAQLDHVGFREVLKMRAEG